MRGELGDELATLLRRLDLDDRRIAEVKLWPGNAGDEGPRSSHPWRFDGGVSLGAHFEIPQRATNINHACNAAPQITRERVVEMRFDPAKFFLVWANLRQINHIGPGKEIARLKEVHMGVDVTGKNEFALAINLSRIRRNLNVVRCSDGGNAIAVQEDGRGANRFFIPRISR
jgi:hypothetical protein